MQGVEDGDARVDREVVVHAGQTYLADDAVPHLEPLRHQLQVGRLQCHHIAVADDVAGVQGAVDNSISLYYKIIIYKDIAINCQYFCRRLNIYSYMTTVFDNHGQHVIIHKPSNVRLPCLNDLQRWPGTVI